MIKQISCFYKDYQILLYPMERTLRDDNVWSHQVMILDQATRQPIYETYYDCDEVFWSDLDTQDKLLARCKRIVDNLEGYDD